MVLSEKVVSLAVLISCVYQTILKSGAKEKSSFVVLGEPDHQEGPVTVIKDFFFLKMIASMGNDKLALGSFEGTSRAVGAGSGLLLFQSGFPNGLVTG